MISLFVYTLFLLIKISPDLVSKDEHTVFRLMLQMGNLERALTAAEMDRSVFLRNITEALGYDEGEKFRIYNYLRRYEK